MNPFFQAFLIIMWVGIVLTLLWAVTTLIRNSAVYRFRQQMLQEVSRLANQDIRNHHYDSWQRRYELLDEPEYSTMVRQFWKPLKPEVWYKVEDMLMPSKPQDEKRL